MLEMAFPHQHHLNLPCLFILLNLLMLFNGSSTATSLASPTNMTTAPKTTKLGCPRRCGNLIVPYPFGIGLGSGCAIGKSYEINCSTSFRPPRGFLMSSNVEVFDISDKYIRINHFVAAAYYKNNLRDNASMVTAWTWLGRGQPYTFSADLNVFRVIGCDDYGWIEGIAEGQNVSSSCMSICSNSTQVTKNTCNGIGCCQTAVPTGLKSLTIEIGTFYKHRNIMFFDRSGYGFLGETDRFTFRGAEDLTDPKFKERVEREVPIVVDWDVGNGTKCAEAKLNKFTYACQGNTSCTDSESYIASGGYRCSCLPGYEGNPYLPRTGCTDIDECAQQSTNNCSHHCFNVIGSYQCSCPKRHDGDGFRNATGCVPHKSQLAMVAGLGTSIGLLFIFICISIIYFIVRSLKLIKVREKFFEQNGGYLLRQQIALTHGGVESSTIFTINELNLATDNFSEDRIIGKGGHGTVYKGILQNNLIVAIKKSKVSDGSQIAEFINEIVILTQINHRNVVKLYGCCLETEVPLLVYEFVPNGTLLEHIQNSSQTYWLTWVNCVRIASQIANAVSYLHSAANPPIIHRDIKSANVLIDNMYSAKVSDFGGSKLIPLDQTQVTTLIQGTLGYLDPEYLHSSQLTEKSDVYSFGVVLAEILTRKKPFYFDKSMKHNNLATFFLTAIKEDHLLEVIYPQLLRETTKENLVFMAMLVKRCLNLNGKDRPTMKEVAKELEGLRDNMKHLWEEPNYEEATSLMESGQVDLYQIPLKINEDLYGNSSGPCSIQKNMMDKMKSPR